MDVYIIVNLHTGWTSIHAENPVLANEADTFAFKFVNLANEAMRTLRNFCHIDLL